MRIVHAASEWYPLIKTGGLADAVGSLTRTLADNGHEVAVFLPGYRRVLERCEIATVNKRLTLKVEVGDQYLQGEIMELAPQPNLKVYLVAREEFFDRENPYGTAARDYDDNDIRFVFFCKAVVEFMRLMEMTADVVNAHDWQTATLPLLLRYEERRHGMALALRTFLTVHNIAFQGIFPMRSFALLNLPEELSGIDGLEYFGQINFLKGGILFADRIITVSPNYAREIQTPRFGCGLDGVVSARADDLTGLLNGIDATVWNPEIDPLIPARYSADDLSGKEVCRKSLLKRAGMSTRFKGPVFGMVCRLTEQKGVEFILGAREFFIKENVRLIVVGSGSRHLEDALQRLSGDHPDRIHLCDRHDEAMSHLVEAGSDFFLMPSIFEPCGLNQLYSQAYGAIPLASRVGGLVDTVVDVDEDPENGTGVMFEPALEPFVRALRRALKIYGNPELLRRIRMNGMRRDFSWRTAAGEYERVYEEAL